MNFLFKLTVYLPNILAFAVLIIFTINENKNVKIVNMIKI